MIFTFYSYKGGVGRSMALAEVAERLASRGLRVLAIDFDLEAPGLERYFFDTERSRSARAEPGLIDLIQTYRHALTSQAAFDEAEFQKLERFRLRAIHVAGKRGGSVDLMTAGRREPADRLADYAVTVRGFDWQDFFTNWRGDLFFDWLRRQLIGGERGYDVVLVDSRTGVTEMGGVCAYQLADVVVLLCAPNYQNLEGTRDVVRDFLSPGVMGLRRGRPLEILALPARIDQNHPKRAEFLEAFARELGVDGMPKRLADIGLDYTTLALPYLREYAVAERPVGGAVSDADRRTREVFDRLADALTLLAGEDSALGKLRGEALDRLQGSADRKDVDLVADASRGSAGYDVSITYGREDYANVAIIRSLMEKDRLRVFDPSKHPRVGVDWTEAIATALEYSRALVVCFGRGSLPKEVERLIARARRLEGVLLVPVLLPGAETSALRSFGLDEFQAIDLTRGPSDDWVGVGTIRTLLENAQTASGTGDATERNPYPGARPYTEDDATFFWGRESEIERLLRAVDASDVVFLSGPAQVGKTSLVKAGLLPRLRSEAESSIEPRWASLQWLDCDSDAKREPPLWLDPVPLPASAQNPAGSFAPNLLVLDGADTFLRDGSQAAIQKRVATIVRAIKRAASLHSKIVVAWRDTLESAQRQAVLDAAAGLRIAHVALEPLTDGPLQQAIEQPALRAGHLLEPGLTQRLIESAGGAQSAAIQLQLALAAIWPRRQRGWLTNKNLDDVGHLGGVFQQHVDSVLDTLDAQQRKAAEVMFKSLATLDTTLKLVPVAQFWGVLATAPAIARIDAVALRDRLAGAGLIDLGRHVAEPSDDDPSRVVTDARLALVRPNAMVYFGGGDVIPDVRFFMWRRGQFANDVERWQRSGRAGDGLIKGNALAEAEDWLGLRNDELSAPERELIEASIALRDRQAAPEADEDPVQRALLRRAHDELHNTSHSVMMLQVDQAIGSGDFIAAKTVLQAMHAMAKSESPSRPADPYIVQRLALVTYKSKSPTELGSLKEALALLATLEPETSNDTYTLGLWGEVHRRLWGLTDDTANLDQAIRAHDRAFYIRNDYYDGITLAFLLNARSALSGQAADAITDFVVAGRVRREVVSICDRMLADNAASADAMALDKSARYWVLAARAEALLGSGDPLAEQALDAAYAAAPETWARDATQERMNKLRSLLAHSPLKRLSAGPWL